MDTALRRQEEESLEESEIPTGHLQVKQNPLPKRVEEVVESGEVS
jgi:hypothetical protein